MIASLTKGLQMPWLIRFLKVMNNDLELDTFCLYLVYNRNNTLFASRNNLLLPQIRTNFRKQIFLNELAQHLQYQPS